MRSFFSASFALLAIAGLTVSTASAQVININYTSGNGPNVPADGNSVDGLNVITPVFAGGTNYNELGGGVLDFADLEDALGNLTGIGVATTLPAAGVMNAGFTFSQDLGDDGVGGLSLVEGYLATTDTFGAAAGFDPLTVTFTGLPASTATTLAIVSQGDTAGQGGTFTVNGVTEVSAGSDPTLTSFVENQNFVLFEDVFTDALGQLTFTYNGNADVPGFAVINALQLVIGDDIRLPCDANNNGVCNTSDFNILRDNLFQFGGAGGDATIDDGDINLDGVVDFADFRLFKDDPLRVIGLDAPPVLDGNNSAVPEPGCVALLAIGALMSLSPSRRRVGRA